jgi:hypothetical protein
MYLPFQSEAFVLLPSSVLSLKLDGNMRVTGARIVCNHRQGIKTVFFVLLGMLRKSVSNDIFDEWDMFAVVAACS